MWTEDRRRIEKLEEVVNSRTEELRRSEKKYRDVVDNAPVRAFSLLRKE